MIVLRLFSDRYHWRQPYDDLNGESLNQADIVTKNGRRLGGEESKSVFRVIKEGSDKTKSHSLRWSKKDGTLVIHGIGFKGEAEDITEATKNGHRNRRSAAVFVSKGNKSGREAYRGFLEYEKTINPHYQIDKETREAVKNEIRRVERNHKIKKGLAIGSLSLAAAVGTGIAAKKIYNKKKKNDSTKTIQ